MSDLVIQFTGPPEKHDDLKKQINTWKYPIEGEVAKGTQSPYIYETRTYLIRCSDELDAKVIRDLQCKDLTNRKSFGVTSNLGTWLIGYLHRFLLLFTPFRYVRPAKGEREYSLPSWFYAVQIGSLKRKKMKILGTKRKRMVL